MSVWYQRFCIARHFDCIDIYAQHLKYGHVEKGINEDIILME